MLDFYFLAPLYETSKSLQEYVSDRPVTNPTILKRDKTKSLFL
jgi:hypothetical protein